MTPSRYEKELQFCNSFFAIKDSGSAHTEKICAFSPTSNPCPTHIQHAVEKDSFENEKDSFENGNVSFAIANDTYRILNR